MPHGEQATPSHREHITPRYEDTPPGKIDIFVPST